MTIDKAVWIDIIGQICSANSKDFKIQDGAYDTEVRFQRLIMLRIMDADWLKFSNPERWLAEIFELN